MEYKGQEVVYIEYQDGKPFSVLTAELDKFTLDTFDFEIDCNDEELFMHYHSGGGGFATEIPAPTLCKGAEKTCCYWLHPKAKLIGEAENIVQITEPLLINNNKNPFTDSREVLQLIYCKVCDEWLDEDWCEHITEDDEGNIRYTTGELHES